MDAHQGKHFLSAFWIRNIYEEKYAVALFSAAVRGGNGNITGSLSKLYPSTLQTLSVSLVTDPRPKLTLILFWPGAQCRED